MGLYHRINYRILSGHRRGWYLLYRVGRWKLYAIGSGSSPSVYFTITPGAGPGGTISPDTAQRLIPARISPSPRPPIRNYAVNTWAVDGEEVQTGGTTFTLSNITADHTVKVTFSYTGPNEQGDWWMFHHDPQHTGRSPFTGPAWV